MTKSSIKIHPLPDDDQPIPKEVGQLSLDVFKSGQKIVVRAPIAGVEMKDIKVSVTDDVLVIRGERKAQSEEQADSFYTKECFWGPFARSIVLPLEADPKKISASFEKSILEIHIPLSEVERTKVIKIKA